MIGVGGSGRQSLTKLATFIREYTFFTIVITKNYKEPQFKDDLRTVLKIAGRDAKNVVFLLSDPQILKESFLEDINNILNTGEVPNLLGTDDIEDIMNNLRPLASKMGKSDTREGLLNFFVQNVRDNIHIVLTLSPVGEKLRNRCRQFPSIINCCTIDWYDRWPDEAIESFLFAKTNRE